MPSSAASVPGLLSVPNTRTLSPSDTRRAVEPARVEPVLVPLGQVDGALEDRVDRDHRERRTAGSAAACSPEGGALADAEHGAHHAGRVRDEGEHRRARAGHEAHRQPHREAGRGQQQHPPDVRGHVHAQQLVASRARRWRGTAPARAGRC